MPMSQIQGLARHSEATITPGVPQCKRVATKLTTKLSFQSAETRISNPETRYRYTVARDGTFKNRRVFAYAGAGVVDGKPRPSVTSCTTTDMSAQEFTVILKAMSMLAVVMAFTCGIPRGLCWVKSFSARRLLTFSLRVMVEWSLALKHTCIMRLWPVKERPSRRVSCWLKSMDVCIV